MHTYQLLPPFLLLDVGRSWYFSLSSCGNWPWPLICHKLWVKCFSHILLSFCLKELLVLRVTPKICQWCLSVHFSWWCWTLNIVFEALYYTPTSLSFCEAIELISSNCLIKYKSLCVLWILRVRLNYSRSLSLNFLVAVLLTPYQQSLNGFRSRILFQNTGACNKWSGRAVTSPLMVPVIQETWSHPQT